MWVVGRSAREASCLDLVFTWQAHDEGVASNVQTYLMFPSPGPYPSLLGLSHRSGHIEIRPPSSPHFMFSGSKHLHATKMSWSERQMDTN
jgi:hypothetical protein